MQGEPFRLAPCKPRTRHASDHSVYRAAADVGRAFQARLGDCAAFAPVALPPSLKLRRTAVALAEAGRRASPKLARRARERRRERVALQATYSTRIGSFRLPGCR